MDKITLEVISCDLDIGIEVKKYDIRVVLNGNVLNHTNFNGEKAIAAIYHEFAQFDLFTCGCGEPGCAGFFMPVTQNKSATTVKWVFPNDNSYKVEKLEYKFDRTDFEKQFESIVNTIVSLEKEDKFLLSCVNNNTSYDEVELVSDLAGAFEKGLKWNKTIFQAKENFYNMLNENFPTISNEEFYIYYDGKKSENKMILMDVISIMLNQWPRKPKDIAFLNKAIKAGKAVENMLMGNNKDFIKTLVKSYKKFSENQNNKEIIWQRFDFDLMNLTNEIDFNIEKFFIKL
jgi:hypothetical protein